MAAATHNSDSLLLYLNRDAVPRAHTVDKLFATVLTLYSNSSCLTNFDSPTSHFDLKRIKNGQNPKKINFSKNFWKLHFYLSRSLSTYRKCRKSVFSGSGWLDGSKMTFFDPKMQRFAIFWWFWVQNHKFTNSAAFGHCLITHI